MEKSELIIDFVEHPERYSDSQVQEMLCDDEAMQFYTTMLEARMAVDRNAAKQVDVDKAWNRFAEQNGGLLERHSVKRRKSAIAYGWRKIAAMFAGVIAISSIAFAAMHIYNSNHVQMHASVEPQNSIAETTATESLKAMPDTLDVAGEKPPVVCKTFENVALGDMLQEIASYYGMTVDFRNIEASRLRYYYEWNSSNGVKAVVDELNHSEQLAIVVEGKKIIVEYPH